MINIRIKSSIDYCAKAWLLTITFTLKVLTVDHFLIEEIGRTGLTAPSYLRIWAKNL